MAISSRCSSSGRWKTPSRSASYSTRHAAALAAEKVSADDKARLRAIVRQCGEMAKRNNRPMEDLVEEMRLGFEIHRIIARASGNDYLDNSLTKIFDKFQHFVWIELLWLNEWEVARREHAAIVEAVCMGDGAPRGRTGAATCPRLQDQHCPLPSRQDGVPGRRRPRLFRSRIGKPGRWKPRTSEARRRSYMTPPPPTARQ